jgi:hypothetical protein
MKEQKPNATGCPLSDLVAKMNQANYWDMPALSAGIHQPVQYACDSAAPVAKPAPEPKAPEARHPDLLDIVGDLLTDGKSLDLFLLFHLSYGINFQYRAIVRFQDNHQEVAFAATPAEAVLLCVERHVKAAR